MPKGHPKVLQLRQTVLTNAQIHEAADHICAYLMDLHISGQQSLAVAANALAQVLSSAPSDDFERIKKVVLVDLDKLATTFHVERLKLQEIMDAQPKVTLD